MMNRYTVMVAEDQIVVEGEDFEITIRGELVIKIDGFAVAAFDNMQWKHIISSAVDAREQSKAA